LREAAYLVTHTIDWGQTSHIADNPDRFREINPILGEHPDSGRVHAYFIATAVLHVTVTHFLPSKWRPAWQYVTFGISAWAAYSNYRVGIKVDF